MEQIREILRQFRKDILEAIPDGAIVNIEYPLEKINSVIKDEGWVKPPSVEELVDIISDAQHYWSFTRRPRSTFVAEWVRDSIKLGCYKKESKHDGDTDIQKIPS